MFCTAMIDHWRVPMFFRQMQRWMCQMPRAWGIGALWLCWPKTSRARCAHNRHWRQWQKSTRQAGLRQQVETMATCLCLKSKKGSDLFPIGLGESVVSVVFPQMTWFQVGWVLWFTPVGGSLVSTSVSPLYLWRWKKEVHERHPFKLRRKWAVVVLLMTAVPSTSAVLWQRGWGWMRYDSVKSWEFWNMFSITSLNISYSIQYIIVYTCFFPKCTY